MSDDPVPTIVLSDEGELPFQEYFVHRRCEPRVNGFRFEGVEAAAPAPGVLSRVAAADLVVICPSNPWVSIDPILALPKLKSALSSRPLVAVSPIIGGQAVKGPVVKMYSELGIEPSAFAVAEHYGELLDGFVFDIVDRELEAEIQRLRVQTLNVQTLMKTSEDRKTLAKLILDFGARL